jgi:adenine-specific DNA-methyltransferase
MPTLHWLTKETDLRKGKQIPFRILEKKEELSVDDSVGNGRDRSLRNNIIIQGDNLEALKAILPVFSGKVKCIYIDPPYNTGNAFEHYDDNMEHTLWLSMIYPRLELLREFLREDGSIWVSIDDDEAHYLKVIMDEIFGRKNFVNNVIWEKKFSPQNDAKWLSDSHDHIICFAKNKEIWRPNLLIRSDGANARYKNLDNDPRGTWASGDISVKTYTEKTDYPITLPSGRIVEPPKGTCWRVTKEKFEELVNENRIWFGADGNNVPRIKRFLSDVKQGITSMTIWNHEDVGHTQECLLRKYKLKRLD